MGFWPEKHFGFIDCPMLREHFGVDTFLSDKEVGPFTTGSVVSFSIMLNKDGKPQAKLLAEAQPMEYGQQAMGQMGQTKAKRSGDEMGQPFSQKMPRIVAPRTAQSQHQDPDQDQSN